MSNKAARWKEIGRKILFPNTLLTFIMVIVSAILLIYVFSYKDANEIITYTGYAFSAYTLTVVIIKTPSLIKKLRNSLYANKYSGKYLSEAHLHAKISLYVGFTINVAYAILKFAAGIYFRSFWIGAIAVYYIILSLIRFGLIRREHYGIKCSNKTEQRKRELKVYRNCGYWMFLLNIAVAGIVIQMIWQNKSFTYPGFLIYASAAYTFYCFTMAIVNLVKYRKLERPILSAAKMISFACALTSMLSLQTALLAEFGTGQSMFIRMMNSLTGGFVCLTVFMLAVHMIRKVNKEIKMENKNE